MGRRSMRPWGVCFCLLLVPPLVSLGQQSEVLEQRGQGIPPGGCGTLDLSSRLTKHCFPKGCLRGMLHVFSSLLFLLFSSFHSFLSHHLPSRCPGLSVPVTASLRESSCLPLLLSRWIAGWGMPMLIPSCTCTGAQRHHVCCVDIKLPGDKEQGGNANVSASFNMLEERIRSRHSNIKNSSVPSLHHHTTLTGIFLAQRGIAAPCHRRNLGNNFRGDHRCGQKQHHRAHVCREH